MPKKWVEEWNEKIDVWIEQGPKYDLGLSHVLNAYKGKGAAELDLDAMPEPYVGDPLHECPEAVMLTLNPGGSGPKQWHPKVSFVDNSLVPLVKSSSYYNVASDYLLEETKKWWSGRSRWPARLLGDSTGKCQLVGIDLIPWHSKTWGGMEFTSDVLPWFKDNVLTPAATIAKRSRLSSYFNLGCPLVLAIGSHHAHCLDKLGFDPPKIVNEKMGIDGWPVSNGQPVKRNFRLFLSKALSLAILQTDAPGTFKPPSKSFDAIVKEILRQSL